MNQLHVGLTKQIELPKGSFLFIGDDVPDHPKAKVFDPLEHRFNPLKGISYKRARELADVLYTIYPQGEDTLTVRGGRRLLARLLLKFPRLDKMEADLWRKAAAHSEDKKNNDPLSPAESEVLGLLSDILLSPVLKSVLCTDAEFAFAGKNRKVFARLNRAEIGEFDALVLGHFLLAHYKGQVIVPDFGFYGREAHVSLIREGRLIAGVNTLQELSPKLRQTVLLIEDKAASGATYEDAELLAMYAGLQPRTVGYNDFVGRVMA